MKNGIVKSATAGTIENYVIIMIRCRTRMPVTTTKRTKLEEELLSTCELYKNKKHIDYQNYLFHCLKPFLFLINQVKTHKDVSM